MQKFRLIIISIICLVFVATLHADECMEGDCDNGFGTGFTEDNKIYEGEWQNGEPHGKGTLYISKGKSITGKWEKGILVSEESLQEKKGKEEEKKP